MADSKDKKVAKTSDGSVRRAARGMTPFEEMDRMFDNFFGNRRQAWMNPFGGHWPSWSAHTAPFEGRTPKVDVIDRDHEVVVKAELPGVKKEDLDVTVGDNSITIRATTKQESKEEKDNYYRSEISSGSFVRTVGLPSAVDADKAKAKFVDGMLEMTLPKVDGAKRRNVKIE